MAKILYLHVGMPKCASTTIQDALQGHAGVFADQGKFYGMPPRDNTRSQGNVSVLLADLRAERKARIREKLNFFFERDSDVIMSSEMFVGLARNPLSDQLIAQARDRGFELRLICYVRRQDHWIESDYKQHIKGGSDWTDGIDVLLARRIKTRVLDYAWLLENWRRSLPAEHITVVPLEHGQGKHHALERFLAFLGMDPGLAPDLSEENSNVSPPTGLIEPLRHLKTGLLARGLKPLEVRDCLTGFVEQAPGRIEVPKRRFLLSRRQREELVAQFAPSNEALSRAYLGGTPAFGTQVEEDPAGQGALDEEAAQVLAAWLASGVDLPGQGESEGTASRPGGAGQRWWWPRRG